MTMKLARRSVFLVFASISTVLAHDPGLSSAALHFNRQTIIAHVTYARADIERLVSIDTDHDGKVSPPEFESARARLEVLAAIALRVTIDDRPVSLRASAVQLSAGDGVEFNLSYLAHGTHLSVSSELIWSLQRGHRQYFTAVDEENRQLAGRILDSANHRVELETAAPARPAAAGSFCRFLILGIEHIVTGYDHLAFLFGLLLVGGAFRSALKIVTAFTLAHSLTLALATFNLIRLSPAIVEPLIAASIVYVGIENIFAGRLEKRWLLVFGFGLFHGCGFATGLKDAGVGTDRSGVALPLFSFNMGVELGQLAIATLVLPLIWKLKQTPNFAFRYAPACSTLIALAGSYWLFQRLGPW